jgi:histidinol-phosphate/aromatic aminotransferase/cobyric acid decarboxylase-like protein
MGSPGYGSGAGRFVGNNVIKVPLRKDYSHDVEAMIKADPNAGAFYICNPNNPTGTFTSRKDFEYILANKKKDAVLIIDEAYVHFSGPENYSTELVRQDKDVVVLLTATACAAASMKTIKTMMPERVAINKKNRELAFEHLDKLGVSYIPSGTNFFMMSVKGMTADQVGKGMAAKKIMLAGANRWPEWPNHIRVTVGTYEEMGKFNAAISSVVKDGAMAKA